MIRLNFIPESQRKQRANLMSEGVGGIPGEVIVGSVAALAGCLVLMHVALAGIGAYKLATHKILEARWDRMGPDKKIYDDVSGELKAIQAKMNTLRPITSAQGLSWAQLLNDISDTIPKGIWLREIVFDKGTLTVYGSAVSKIQNEMVDVGNFVAALKEKPGIKNNFTGVDVDSIQRRENAAVSVADFSLKAKLK